MAGELRKFFLCSAIIVAATCAQKKGLDKECSFRCVPAHQCPRVRRLNANDQSWLEDNSCEISQDFESIYPPPFPWRVNGVCCPDYEDAIIFKESNGNNAKSNQRLVLGNDNENRHDSGSLEDYKTTHQRRNTDKEFRFDPSTTENPYFLPREKYPAFDQHGQRNSRRNGPPPPPPLAQNPMDPGIGGYIINDKPVVQQYRPKGLDLPQMSTPRSINTQGGLGASHSRCSEYSAYPVDPRSGCCGVDLTEVKRIEAQQFPGNRDTLRDANARRGFVPSWMYDQDGSYSSGNRFKRSNGSTSVSIENRISGGSATELGQFPWTLLLQVHFLFSDKEVVVNCGASLISARYVLTAAHCFSEGNGKVSKVLVNLAEYDKRTFPRDCISTSSGQQCINNMVISAPNFIQHPEYNDNTLQNDIALLRLSKPAPYTDNIRPICLPTINIDKPDLQDLPLSVAGWGRTGSTTTSDVKLSAVMHLVHRQACKRDYPSLSQTHICATGHTGEDTCKGDSGGPLMTLYEGVYYVAGIVSGKRSDSPCGTDVPSLYTNVHLYTDWIWSNVKE